ncbi:MAG: helix-turn-helix domain-containing protein [Patescibacteria group bacterium]
MKKIFTKLGLSEKESSIYLALLELGPAIVTTIASKAKINRTTCYDILEQLINMGLISKVSKTHKKTYTAESPETLISYLEKKSQDLHHKAHEVKKILPELKAIYSEKGKQPRVRFYEGIKGIETVYEDTLTSHETIKAYASVANMHKALPHYFPDYYHRRANKGIFIKAILPADEEGFKRKKHDKTEARESRLVPIDRFNFSPEINIYDDKVAIMSLAEEFGIIIESKEIAEAQKKIFDLAWEAAKKHDELLSH